eukprot:1159730-Pelagomonas_calceolata.AAC.2
MVAEPGFPWTYNNSAPASWTYSYLPNVQTHEEVMNGSWTRRSPQLASRQYLELQKLANHVWMQHFQHKRLMHAHLHMHVPGIAPNSALPTSCMPTQPPCATLTVHCPHCVHA